MLDIKVQHHGLTDSYVVPGVSVVFSVWLLRGAADGIDDATEIKIIGDALEPVFILKSISWSNEYVQASTFLVSLGMGRSNRIFFKFLMLLCRGQSTARRFVLLVRRATKLDVIP